MRKRLTMAVAASALVAAMLPGVASAAATGDSITGSVMVDAGSPPSGGVCTYLRVIVSVQSGPSGEDPSGNIVLLGGRTCDFGPGGNTRSADILCMFVVEDKAAVITEFKDDDRPFGEGFPFLVVLAEDNGPPNGGTPDNVVGGARDNADCEQAFGGIVPSGVWPVATGNLVVSDS